MKARNEVIEILRRRLPELRNTGVVELGLFGSVARDEQNLNSDVDILVDLKRNTFDSYMDVLFLLEEMLGSKVDLVVKESLKPGIKDSILSETVYVEKI
jgi:predicted nucleotidyltransferase